MIATAPVTALKVEREMRKELLTPTVNINEMEVCLTYLSVLKTQELHDISVRWRCVQRVSVVNIHQCGNRCLSLRKSGPEEQNLAMG